jgi:hypothetical protein
METYTEESAVHRTHGKHAAAQEAEPIDPEHDIQAKTTVIWLTACTVGVLLTLWVLKGFFSLAVQGEREAKIEQLAPAELEALRAGERAKLQPTSGKKIDDTLQDYLKK